MSVNIKLVTIAVILIALFIPKTIYQNINSLETVQIVFNNVPSWHHKIVSTLVGTENYGIDLSSVDSQHMNIYYQYAQKQGFLNPNNIGIKQNYRQYNNIQSLYKRGKSEKKSTEDNLTIPIENTIEYANGQTENRTETNAQFANLTQIKTSGYKVLDIIQACYMPSNLSVCGVNAPVYYLVDSQVGTPAQELQSIVDINTFETYFTTCNTLTNCTSSKSANLYSCMYNSFDANISFSYNYDTTQYQTNFVESKSLKNLSGCWSYDNVTIGGKSSKYENVHMDYFEFPTVNANSDNAYFQSVLGLGLDGLYSQNTLSSSNKKKSKEVANQNSTSYNTSFLEGVKVYGGINSRSYSMYVGEDGTGKLILGGIDEAKIDGNLTYFKDLETKEFVSSLVKGNKKSNVKIYRPSINITGVKLGEVDSWKKQKLSYDAVIESTERFITAPKKFVTTVVSKYKKKYELKNADLRYYMNCTLANDNTEQPPLELEFSEGLKVSIPFSSLVFKNLNPATNTKKNRDCVFALNYKNNQDYFVLGQTFLNNVYFHSDLERNQYAIGKMKQSSAEHIRVVQ